MIKSDLGRVDLEIAEYYAPLVLGSLKHGENRICVWFPGCGKTNAINSVLSNKSLLKRNLEALYKRVVFIPFSGHDSENALSSEVLQQIYLKLVKKLTAQPNEMSVNNIIAECRKIINQGREIVFIGNEIENLSQIEYNKLLNNLLRITLMNRARIHTIINIKNKSMYDKAILSNNSLLTLSNKIQYIPILTGDLLRKLVYKFIYIFDKRISQKEILRIEKYTGGISILTKELIRNYPDEGQLGLKLRECLNHMSKKTLESTLELRNYKAHNLTIIKTAKNIIDKNPLRSFTSIANDNELKIYNFLIKNKNKLISKDNVADIIWGDNEDSDYSDWAIDQIISRFRKKLIQVEINPESLETIKGKGYKWKP